MTLTVTVNWEGMSKGGGEDPAWRLPWIDRHPVTGRIQARREAV